MNTGQIVSGANPPASAVRVRVGGVDTNAWVGLVASGQYQINLQVPVLPNGEAAVSVEVGGQTSPTGPVVPIQR
jgi:uncharacterized protein (TIGR03437 family)